jgi:hypothetical protein
MVIQKPGQNCLVAAAAGLFGISYNSLVYYMNVNPNENVWPHMPTPLNMRATHIQEINLVGLTCGFGTFTEFYPDVMLASCPDVTPVNIHTDMYHVYAFINKGIVCTGTPAHAYIKTEDGLEDLRGHYVKSIDDLIRNCYCILHFRSSSS